MERIFISYKRVNVGHVEILKDKIEETLGVKCWFDLERIESGDQFPIELCDAIDNAEVVLFMHSYAHLGIDYKKDWTVKELNYAHKNDKKVVLVRLDDAPLKKIFLMNYDQSDIIDSRRPDQWEKLMKDLSRWLSPSDSKPKVYSDAELRDLYNKGVEFYKKKQYPEAVECYRLAAEQGYTSAQTYLGYMYEKGYGVAKDYGEAVRWYRKAAEQGDVSAQYNLGLMYRHGYGVTKDYGEAVRWFRKAAEQNHANAQTNLGVMYQKGYGVTKDYGEAVRWYRKAAEQGYATAQYNMGLMYKNGFGVEKDLTQARYWYQKAADQGDEDAKKALARMNA